MANICRFPTDFLPSMHKWMKNLTGVKRKKDILHFTESLMGSQLKWQLKFAGWAINQIEIQFNSAGHSLVSLNKTTTSA